MAPIDRTKLRGKLRNLISQLYGLRELRKNGLNALRDQIELDGSTVNYRTDVQKFFD